MKAQKNQQSFFLIGMAICEAMRHTGTNVVTSGLSSQINGPKVEMAPDFLKEAVKLETQNTDAIILNKENDPFDSLMALKKKSTNRKKITDVPTNTAPLKHYKNPRRFRRG